MTSIESIESAQAFVKAMLSLGRRTDTAFRFIAQCIKKYRLRFTTQTVFLYLRYYPILDMQHDTK